MIIRGGTVDRMGNPDVAHPPPNMDHGALDEDGTFGLPTTMLLEGVVHNVLDGTLKWGGFLVLRSIKAECYGSCSQPPSGVKSGSDRCRILVGIRCQDAKKNVCGQTGSANTSGCPQGRLSNRCLQVCEAVAAL